MEDEITSTTLRNRSSMKKASKKNPVTPTPPLPKEARKKGVTPKQFKKNFEEHERSDKDRKEDQARAHHLHISLVKYELSPEDRRKDIRGAINKSVQQLKRKK